jgi:hypothetical protein
VRPHGRTPFVFRLRLRWIVLRALEIPPDRYTGGTPWIVKFPFPLHPVKPVSIQVPEMVLPFTVPWSVSTLLVAPGNIVVMVISKVPVTLPLKLPIKPKVAVSVVWSEAKHDPADVKVKLVTLTELPLPWVKVVEKE